MSTTIMTTRGTLATALANAAVGTATKDSDRTALLYTRISRPALECVHIVVPESCPALLEATDGYIAVRQQLIADVAGPAGAWLVHRDHVIAAARLLKKRPTSQVTLTLGDALVIASDEDTATYPLAPHQFPNLDKIWPNIAMMHGTNAPVGFSLRLLARIAKIVPPIDHPDHPATFYLNGPNRAALVRVLNADAEVALMPYGI